MISHKIYLTWFSLPITCVQQNILHPIRAYFERDHNLLFGKDNVADAVVATAMEQIVNPVKARIETEKWDGIPRAERYFVDYLGAEDNEYTKAVTKAWLTGTTKRVYQPGCKFELVPVLEGRQGLGKSTAVRNLYPDRFSDTLKGLGKTDEDYKKLQGNWIFELGELTALRKTEIESVKNFISAQSDTYRNSYGHFASPHSRKCSFIGTTNQTDYLKDITGERRFYPVKCGVTKPTKNVWKPDQHDILQVLAEAKVWNDNHEKAYLDSKMMIVAKQYQQEAETIDPMKEAIIDFFNDAGSE